MKLETQNSNAGFRQDGPPSISDFVRMSTLGRIQPQIGDSLWSVPEIEKSLAKNREALLIAYLDANLNSTSVPLKEFMDDLEKNILVACLRLTHGSQRNAAALLGIKPTALFEKMRKHRINGRRIKLSEKLEAAPPREIA